MRLHRLRRLAIVAPAVACLLGLAACAGGGPSDIPGGSPAPAGGQSVQLFGFGVAKSAYEKLIPAFTKTPAGAGIQFQESYGPSGDQSRKVASGAPADFVAFSVAPDITRLVNAGRIPDTWEAGRNHGVPFGSVVALIVRPGNPKGINDWPDLLRPGVEVITPNPLSSGSAKWNLLAPYAVHSDGGRDPAAGIDYVRTLITKHVHLQPKSSREASEAFLQGSADVLISYENEAKYLQSHGEPVQIVHLPDTFRIDLPVAVIPDGSGHEAARAFEAYLSTTPAQEVVAEAGFRPSDPAVLASHERDFPAPRTLWNIDDLGGWPAVDTELFEPTSGAITAIYNEANR